MATAEGTLFLAERANPLSPIEVVSAYALLGSPRYQISQGELKPLLQLDRSMRAKVLIRMCVHLLGKRAITSENEGSHNKQVSN